MGTGSGSAAPAAAKKGRHIVSWSSEEDELLREQALANSDDNWAAVAARLKDKTARQCRRRWYTLNSERKKCSWSAEEDSILCEAQRLFGNRWTEIAKIVYGRTDNAVKNRFSILSRKRKLDGSKENINPCAGTSNTKMVTQNVTDANKLGVPVAPRDFRYQSRDHTEEQQSRPPLSVLAPNFRHSNALHAPPKIEVPPKEANHCVSIVKSGPKVSASFQQAAPSPLSSFDVKLNAENSSQSLEGTWKVLQNYFIPKEDSKNDRTIRGFEVSSIPQHGVCSSMENREVEHEPCSRIEAMTIVSSSEEPELGVEDIDIRSNLEFGSPPKLEFSSPLQMIPPFPSLSVGVPTPKLTESERIFLISIFGMSPSPPTPPSSPQKPSCKRALVSSL